MKSNCLIGLYNSSSELIGYFHNEQEIKEYIFLMNERKLCDTKVWFTNVKEFIV